MILPDINTASQYLPSLNLTVNNARLTDFFDRAQAWVVEKIIGTDIEEDLEEIIIDPYEDGGLMVEPEDSHSELRKLVQRLIAVRAYMTAIPEMDLQLSEAGFVVQSNEYMSPASKERTANLIRSLELRLCEDADALVRFLWSNSTSQAQYAVWRDSDQFFFISSVFCPFCYLYNQLQPPTARITNYVDFLEMLPKMDDAADTVVAAYVSSDELDRLLDIYRTNGLNNTQFKAVKKMLKAMTASVRGDKNMARCAAIEARNIMVNNLEHFPEFADSPCRNLPRTSFGNGRSWNGL